MKSMTKQIAVVGSGISGSLCARLLATKHHVTLFEAADELGGHTHTAKVEAFGSTWLVDTGFMVFNDRTYPNFIRMLELLGVDSQLSDMSFSVHCKRSGLEYQGSSLNGLFAQRSNLVSPRFLRMLRDIFRFNRQSQELLETPNDQLTLGDFLEREGYSLEFAQHYLLPMTAAIWSAPPGAMTAFPIKFLAQFLQNHGLLQVFDRPQWRTIPGGARNYLDALLHPLGDSVRTQSPVTSVRRLPDGVDLTVCDERHQYDAVVLATHAPHSLAMLEEPSSREQAVLGAFQYQANEAYVHLDESMLPDRRRARASWNYRLSEDTSLPASLTYDLSRLQRVPTPSPILQTLNPTEPIQPEKILQRLQFEHPLFNAETRQAQQHHEELHKDRKIYYCGAYWGYGFHEDGVNSALKVCENFDINLEHLTQPHQTASCIAASTKAESNTCAESP